MSDTDLTLQEDECCALEAIYGEAVSVERDERLVEVCVAHPGGGRHEVVLRASLPPDYPSARGPVVELHAAHVADDVLGWAAHELEAMFTPGDVVLYNWVEWLKEQELLWPCPKGPGEGGAAADGEEVPQGRGVEGANPSRRQKEPSGAVREAEAWELLRSLRVTSGEPTVEKKSTFQAHVAPVSSFEEVAAIMDALLSISKIRAATHNIMAYRIEHGGAGAGAGSGAAGKSSFLQDYDDDGETAAGGRLLHLLQAADVRNVVVVVSRWFGGVLMGPQRFTAINNCARALLEQMGLVGGGGGAGGGKGEGAHGGKGQGAGGRKGGR